MQVLVKDKEALDDASALLAEFDTLDRISYIGKLYREVELIDFSMPVIQYLVDNPIPEPIKIKDVKKVIVEKSYFDPPREVISTNFTVDSIEQTTIKILSTIPMTETSRDYKSASAALVHNFVENVGKIVSIQPMTAPVALSFRLKHVNNSTLSVVSTALEASTRKLPSINLESYPFTSEAVGTASCIHDSLVDIYENIINKISDNALEQTFDIREHKISSRIYELANEIAIRSKRGIANILLISDEFVPTFMRELDCKLDISTKRTKFKEFGLNYIGELHGRIKVYSTTALYGKNEMLLGYNGRGCDSGVVFAPYVLYNHARVIDVVSFIPKMSTMTRSAMDVTDTSKFYTKILYK